MGKGIEDLDLMLKAETICDPIWKAVKKWQKFDMDTVGSQLTRAADSVGANIAESHGRYSYGEKIQFLLYSRGSLYETKYWLRRCDSRSLLDSTEIKKLADELDDLARDVNNYIRYLRQQRNKPKSNT